MLSQIKASNNNAMYLYQLVAVRKTLLCETKE